MSEKNFPDAGKVAWVDLTVGNADKVKDFYGEVVGWKSEAVEMGDYSDYSMIPPEAKEAVAGVCHARGTNAGMPPVWMIYILVADLDHSIERCVALGGSVKIQPKQMGGSGRYCVIEDPAGAVAALFEPKRD